MAGLADNFNHRTHGDNAAEVADRLKLSPTGTFILADCHANRVESGKHDDALLACRIFYPEEGRHFL